MELLFNLLSLYYVYRSVRLAVELWQQRQRLRVEPLSRWQVHAGEQAAFFLAVPVAVAVHELGHAVAIWAYGGEVVQFAYRFFWGYVLPRGSFTLEERWIIAVAGTAGSLLAGLAIWGAGHLSRSSALRYFGRRALRLQIFFSLIYYPVFSAIGLFGDWVTIYRFSATPLLAGVMAGVHAGLLLAYWWADRRGAFEMPAVEHAAGAARLAHLRREAAAGRDPEAQLELADLLQAAGAPRQARRALEAYLARFPRSPRAMVRLAVLDAGGRRQIPRRAARNAERALAFGLHEPSERALAHSLLAARLQDMGRPKEALPHLDQAIQAAVLGPTPSNQARLLRRRAEVHRQLGQRAAAYQDATSGLRLAQAAGDTAEGAQLEALVRDLERAGP